MDTNNQSKQKKSWEHYLSLLLPKAVQIKLSVKYKYIKNSGWLSRYQFERFNSTRAGNINVNY